MRINPRDLKKTSLGTHLITEDTSHTNMERGLGSWQHTILIQIGFNKTEVISNSVNKIKVLAVYDSV
jgi:hypothetical protein